MYQLNIFQTSTFWAIEKSRDYISIYAYLCKCVWMYGLLIWECLGWYHSSYFMWKYGKILDLVDCVCKKYLFLKIPPNHCLLPSLIGHSVLFSGKIHQKLGSKMETQNLNQLISFIFCLLNQELRPGEFNYSFEDHIFVLKGRSLKAA